MYPFFKVQKNSVKQSSLTLLLVLVSLLCLLPFKSSASSPSGFISLCYHHHSGCPGTTINECNAYYESFNHFDGYCYYVDWFKNGVNDDQGTYGYVILGSSSPLGSPSNNGQGTCSASSPNNYTSHPINIAMGNKFFTTNYFTGQGAKPLSLSFYYNSNVAITTSPDARAWTADYRQSLVLAEGVDVITAKRANGKILSFLVSDGVINSPSQRTEQLILTDDGYQLRLAGNAVENYTAEGELQSIRYANGSVHTLTYDDNDIIIAHKNDRLILTVDSGNVARATLPDNSIIDYSYVRQGDVVQLTTVTYPDGTTRTYLYENTTFPHYITGILDENGNRISSVAYDDQGRAISSEVGELGSGIERSQIEYHDDGTRTVTNALGKKNTYHFTQFNGEYKMTQVEGHASDNCASANQAYTYDTNGFMASKTDWNGNVTTYVHNDRGLETSRTEASGTPQARTITTEWHATFNLRTKTTEPERETVFTYDAQGRLTSTEVTPR